MSSSRDDGGGFQRLLGSGHEGILYSFGYTSILRSHAWNTNERECERRQQVKLSPISASPVLTHGLENGQGILAWIVPFDYDGAQLVHAQRLG